MLKRFYSFLFIFTVIGVLPLSRIDAQIVMPVSQQEWIIRFSETSTLGSSLAGIYGIPLKPFSGIEITEEIYLNEIFKHHQIETRVRKLFSTAPKDHTDYGFDRMFTVSVTANQSLKDINGLIALFKSDPNITYIEENKLFRVDRVSADDPFADSLYWVDLLQANQAWGIEDGSDSVIIGVIDTGIDYFHPDLQNRIYINSGETGLDGNGLDKRFNGIDDDGNGYIDDWRGWDFTDIPGLNDSGDVSIQDNDPMDENGHGTAVSGIIAAEGHNGLGIIGLAHGCKVLAIRCGTASGFLQIDDIAQAIVYAADQGARVINMSFSDVTLSALLRDAVEYAYQKNCVLVASAGNDASTQLRYPAGFDHVIAVSATDRDDFIAPFSNYGSWITVTAPGVNIFTVSLNAQYRFMSGTSASAPLVAGLAGLILSRYPDMNHETVRSVMATSADDIGNMGWDPYYGAGRINALRALQTPYATVARIEYPSTNHGVASDTLIITGTTAGALLKQYTLYYGTGNNPSVWNEIIRVQDRQKVSDTLAVISISGWNDGNYVLRLKAENKDGSVHEARNRFFIDRSAPTIFSFMNKKMILQNNYANYISFRTDDFCKSALFIRNDASTDSFTEIPVQTLSKTHSILIEPATVMGLTGSLTAELFIEAENTSGLITRHPSSGFMPLDLSGRDFSNSLWKEDTTFHLPRLYLLPRTVDLDGNGYLDLIANDLTAGHQFRELKIFEYDHAYPGRFREKLAYGLNGVPRDVLSNAFDGKSRFLFGDADRTIILESADSFSVPARQIFRDSNDFWGSRFLTFSGDPDLYLLSKQGTNYQIHKQTGQSSWTKINTIQNPSRGENLIGVPGSAVGDFDGDGQPDILLGDYDGDIYIIEKQGESYVQVWRDSLPLIDPCGFLTAGDIDNDGVDEFIVGCRTDDSDGNADPNASFWLFRVYRRTGDNQYQVFWEQYIYGYYPQRDYRSGLHVANVDADPGDEILINAYPNGYIFKWNIANQNMDLIWNHFPVRSNVILVADPDRNGTSDLILNDGTKTITCSFTGDMNIIRPPDHFSVVPVDTQRVRLSWRIVPGADHYRLYSGLSYDQLQWFADLSPACGDTVIAGLLPYQKLYFAVSAVVQGIESPVSPALYATPNPPPRLTGGTVVNDRQLTLSFSEPMDKASMNRLYAYRLSGHDWPLSAISMQSGQAVLLTYPELFSGTHQITVSDLQDTDGTFIDSSANRFNFNITKPEKRMAIVKCEYRGQNRIAVFFSDPVDRVSAEQIAHYKVEPGFTIVEAKLDSNDPKIVILQVSGPYPIGALGLQYIIQANGIQSADGKLLDEIYGNRSALLLTQTTLKNVFVYPNPCNLNEPSDLTFANLTSSVTIRIYSADGRFIRQIQENNADGGVKWDLRDHQGGKIPAGIYIFTAESGKLRSKGKFAVVK